MLTDHRMIGGRSRRFSLQSFSPPLSHVFYFSVSIMHDSHDSSLNMKHGRKRENACRSNVQSVVHN